MRVIIDPAGFQEVVIVLERREEAIVLWHCLDIAHRRTMGEYLQDTNLSIRESKFIKTKGRMWGALSDMITKKGDCIRGGEE